MCRMYEINEMRLAREVVIFKAGLRVCGSHDVIIATLYVYKEREKRLS